jgi:ribonuclease G
MNHLVITEIEDARLILLLDEFNHLLECHPYKKGGNSSVGNIYTGIVKNKIKGINGFFIDYGSEKDGFLPITPTNKHLSIGQSVLIQIEKDAFEQKGAKVTTDLSFSGEFCVLVTDSHTLHFSSKLPEDDRTQELKQLFLQYKHINYGFIVRTNGYAGDNELIEEEINVLIGHYNRIKETQMYRSIKTCLYNNNETWLKSVQNMNKSLINAITVSSQGLKESIEGYLMDIGLHNNISVNIDEAIYVKLDVPGRLKKACQRKLWLNSGASIIIEKTEAMYVIDVNSNKNISKQGQAKNIFKINQEAAKEIIYQIRLRNMSGIILIDFIDMDSEEDKKRLVSFLEQQVTFDPVKTVVHGLTHLGIMEMSRKRIERPLLEKLGEYTQFKSFTQQLF